MLSPRATIRPGAGVATRAIGRLGLAVAGVALGGLSLIDIGTDLIIEFILLAFGLGGGSVVGNGDDDGPGA